MFIGPTSQSPCNPPKSDRGSSLSTSMDCTNLFYMHKRFFDLLQLKSSTSIGWYCALFLPTIKSDHTPHHILEILKSLHS